MTGTQRQLDCDPLDGAPFLAPTKEFGWHSRSQKQALLVMLRRCSEDKKHIRFVSPEASSKLLRPHPAQLCSRHHSPKHHSLPYTSLLI